MSIRKKRRKARVLSLEEKTKIFQACRTLQERLVIRLLQNVGSRRITCASLKIEYFNFASKMLNIETQEKTFKPIHISLNNETMQDLQMYITEKLKGAKMGYLFPSYGRSGHLTDKQIYNIVCKVAKRAGLIDVLPHDFRKTFMKTAGINNLPSNMVANAMGVDPKTMIKYYEEYTPEELQEQFKKIQI